MLAGAASRVATTVYVVAGASNREEQVNREYMKSGVFATGGSESDES